MLPKKDWVSWIGTEWGTADLCELPASTLGLLVLAKGQACAVEALGWDWVSGLGRGLTPEPQ